MPRLREFEKLQGITISFSAEQYARLVQLAQDKQRSMAFLVREAVDSCYPETADSAAPAESREVVAAGV